MQNILLCHMILNLISLGFGVLVGERKDFEDDILKVGEINVLLLWNILKP